MQAELYPHLGLCYAAGIASRRMCACSGRLCFVWVRLGKGGWSGGLLPGGKVRELGGECGEVSQRGGGGGGGGMKYILVGEVLSVQLTSKLEGLCGGVRTEGVEREREKGGIGKRQRKGVATLPCGSG